MPGAAEAALKPAETVLRRACDGDQEAFAELVRVHERMVFGLAVHAVHDRDAAEELAQEVFVRLYRSLQSIESSQHLVFWLRRVTSQRCIDYIRRERKRAPMFSGDLIEQGCWPATRDPLLARTVRRLVATLPAKARLIVALRYQEDLEPADISGILNMPVNTVKSQLRRSLAFLRSKLDVPPR